MLQTLETLYPRQAYQAAELIKNKAALVYYGATYGIAFSGTQRELVATLRKETRNPLPTVSIVTGHDTAKSWVNRKLIHPKISEAIDQGILHTIEDICFVNYPAGLAAQQHLHTCSINPQREIQPFIVSYPNPLINNLSIFEQNHYLVRSGNFEGEQETSYLESAIKFAEQTGLALIVHSLYETILSDSTRLRRGSQPIIRLPQVGDENPLIQITRAGNTHPDTLKALLQPFQELGFPILANEAKATSFSREVYKAPETITDPKRLRLHLLQVSGLS